MGPGSQQRYLNLAAAFRDHVKERHRRVLPKVHPPPDLDELLYGFVHERFWEGDELFDATAVLAAMGWTFPAAGRHGSFFLPLTRQALAGFARLSPLRSRLPLPPPVTSAIANAIVWRGRRRQAIGVKVGEAGYLRPGELCGLRRRQLIAPASRLRAHH